MSKYSYTMTRRPLRHLLTFYLAFLAAPTAAYALSGGTADVADRFPFVVEVNLRGKLVCSGTVLYPRIVVTAAHCLQQKIYLRGVKFYADDYLGPTDLSVRVVRMGQSETYPVEETVISPIWRAFTRKNSIGRFPHDLALLITKDPIRVEPPSTLASAGAPHVAGIFPVSSQRGILVAFGGERCSSAIGCEDAGIRRFIPVAIKEHSYCFKNLRERDLLSPHSVWCIETGVMPGDSGGALLVEAEDSKLYYVGVISAQQGLPPELSAVASHYRTLAAALSANLTFIAEKAKELGYASDP